MTKKSEETTRKNLEDSLKALELDKIYKDFFTKDVSSIYDEKCDAFNTLGTEKENVKKVCTKLVRFVKKISELEKEEESAKYCKYLPYWLYDEIGGIHLDHTTNFFKIRYAQELIRIGNAVNKEINKNSCTVIPDYAVTLDELIKRKYMFIYYKNQTNIENTINSQSTYDCNNYFTYLTNIKLLYDKLKNDKCKPNFFPFSFKSDYFSCENTKDPADLLPKAKECKAKGSGGGWGKIFGILFGGSSSRTDANRNGTLTQAATRVGGLETKTPGSGKNLSPALLPKDKGVKETTESTVAEDKSKGLSSLTSSPSTGALAGPVAGSASSLQTGSLNPKGGFSTQSSGSPALGVLPLSPNTLDTRRDAVLVPIADSPTTLEGVSDRLDTNIYRNIIMTAAIIGTILFLFYYNMSSGLKSNFPKRKRKKKIFEHNYYEEYEKELEKYESENESLDSQSDRYYLNYKPEGDTYY